MTYLNLNQKENENVVRLFKKTGSRNYYFQIMLNGKRIVESTRMSNLKDAAKRAEERCMELKLNLNYYFYLEKAIKMLELMSPEERDEALKRSIEELNSIIVKNVTLEETFGLFSKKPRKRSISKRSYVVYQSLWEKFTEFIRKNYPEAKYLSDITRAMAEKYLYSEWEKGITERTYNERITKFRTIFSALAEEAGLRKNVWHQVDKMTEGHISKRPFSKSQIDAIFRIAEGEMRTLCMIGLYTGLRLGDAATLKWDEIDFENSVISRLPNKTKKLRKNVEIPLLGGLRSELLRLKALSQKDEIYVLPVMAEKYMTNPASLSLTVQAFFQKAGIETMISRDGVTRKSTVYGFHSFRHSFVSLCAANGIPMNVVMELVGHRSAMVHEIYQHASAEQKIKAINVIEKEFLA
ncbi:site-specific integrase [bacterium]|nr:site-specific integrase [bacterium]